MWFIEKRRLLPFLNHYEKYVIHMEGIFKGGGWDKERERENQTLAEYTEMLHRASREHSPQTCTSSQNE